MNHKDRDALVNEIRDSLMMIRRRMAERRHGLMPADLHIPPGQAALLHIVGCRGSLSVKELAEHMHVSGSAITQMADPLVKLGLLSREADESDRRVSRISLTDHGCQVVKKLKKFHMEEIGRMLDPLDETELATFRNLLGKIIEP